MSEASPIKVDSSPLSKADQSSGTLNGPAEAGPSRSSSPAKKRLSLLDDSDSDLTEDEDDLPAEAVAKATPARDSHQARERYHADLKKHTYEPPKAERPQDDWQVAYIWAFIAKFKQREKIPRLECLEDFERSLMEPVANRPDDVLEGVLIRFLKNLKPGLRQLDCTNIQHHLSHYISEALQTSSEFTVWDRPWAPNEEPRAVCCNPSEERLELGRLRGPGEPISERVEKNPIRRIEAKGGGIFEMDWHERVKMLRQLVDWQLTHSEVIRADISADQKLSKTALANGEGVRVEPVGQDRDKNRIWALDTSGRLYKSGNPFKRPCPIFAISSNRGEMAERIEEFKTYGDSTPPAPPKAKGKAAAAKPSRSEVIAKKKLLKGIEDEKALGEALEKMMPDVEKEDTRISRARRRIQQAAELASMAEIRSTRTRRSTNKVNYLDNYVLDDDFDDYDDHPRKRRNAAQDNSEWRPVVTGERSSARLAQSNGHLRDSSPSSVTTSNGGYGANGNGDRRSGHSRRGQDNPFEGMSEREKNKMLREQEEAMRQIEEQRRHQEEEANGHGDDVEEDDDDNQTRDEVEEQEDVSMEDDAAKSTIAEGHESTIAEDAVEAQDNETTLVSSNGDAEVKLGIEVPAANGHTANLKAALQPDSTVTQGIVQQSKMEVDAAATENLVAEA